MHKKYLATAGLVGATGVILGAFGAHGLQSATTDEKILHAFQTGVQYQLYHALALLFLSILTMNVTSKWIKWAYTSFCFGLLFFCGSLYLMTWLRVYQQVEAKWLGPVTPFGGLLLIAGWLFVFYAAMDKKRS